MDYLSHNIAVNLKRIRTSKGMSLDVVAEQTGVSKTMLHHIEKGDANPSINVLGKIVSGLRIEFNELIQPPPMDTCLVNIKDMIPTKEIPGEYTVWTCFPYEDNRKAEIYRIDIEAHGVYVSGGHGEKTREYVAVLSGEVEIEVNKTIHKVTENDVFRFESEHTHKYSNNTEEKISILSIFVA
ncbi:MAG: XRE family transcriptional regulator [Clostridia bacterium]|nr:XRE family transcriptional regulator [Clostridia bacterium]